MQTLTSARCKFQLVRGASVSGRDQRGDRKGLFLILCTAYIFYSIKLPCVCEATNVFPLNFCMHNLELSLYRFD